MTKEVGVGKLCDRGRERIINQLVSGLMIHARLISLHYLGVCANSKGLICYIANSFKECDFLTID